MATKRYDAVVSTGSYTDQNGNTKQRWMNIGVVLETKNGLVLKLEALPIPNENGEVWIKFFEPRGNEQREPQKPRQADLDDDMASIPF